MLSSAELALLRRLGGWSIADLLLDPERGAQHLRDSRWGGSYVDESWFQCERRGIEVYTYEPPEADFDREAMRAVALDQPLVRRTVMLLRWPQIARYAAQMPGSVRAELRAARDHHRAVGRAYTESSHRQPWEPAYKFDQDLWDAHMAEYRPAVARLDAALDAALGESAPEQLDMFAGLGPGGAS